MAGGGKTWELFLLVVFTRLKTVIVVMVPRSGVGWCPENTEATGTKRCRQLGNHDPRGFLNFWGTVFLCLLCAVICASVEMDVSSDLLGSYLLVNRLKGRGLNPIITKKRKNKPM